MSISNDKFGLPTLRQAARKRALRTLSRARQAAFLGPNLTLWLNRLLKTKELTPDQRSRLAFSGAWLVAPLTIARDILNGVQPQNHLYQQKKSRLFAETLCDIDPSILHRHWPGHPNDLEFIRRILGKMAHRPIATVVPINPPDPLP